MSVNGIGSSVPTTPSVASEQPQRAQAEPAAPQPEPETATHRVDPRQIEAIARRLDSYMKSVSRSIEFKVDAASGRTVVSVRDTETGDLIRQIPSEEVLHLAQMAEDQTVVLVNEEV